MYSDEFYIKRCNELAVLAEREGNPAVGSLIVFQGEVIYEAQEAGRSKNDVTCHAEIEAIRGALKKMSVNTLKGAVMYSSHEPCVMCSYAIRYYKISKVVYQNKVPYLGGVSSSMPLLISRDVPESWGEAPEVIHYLT
jgi:tRNA(adenine34) deaminase